MAAEPSREERCAHCGLPVPPGLVEPEAAEQFCCHGCRTVRAAIRESGLESFYGLRAASGATPIPAPSTGRQYAELDDPVFRDLYCAERPDGTQAVELYLEGVHCSACVWIVEKLPRVLPGVVEARLDLRRSLLRVVWDDAQVPLSRVGRTLDSLGYPPHPARDLEARRLRQQEDRRFLVRIGVAAACAGNVMVLAFALYGGWFSGMEQEYAMLFRRVSAAIGLVALVGPGNLFLRGAWGALRTRTAHLDLPIALALVAGASAGTVNAVTGRGEVYFDSLTMLIFLLLVGRWFQRRQQRWAADAVELLYSVTPTSARRVRGQSVEEVPVEALAAGDAVEVRAGDSIPADGVVAEGDSSVDLSLLTGESRPVEVTAGQGVHAGSVNLGATLRVRVHATGAATRVGKLMRLVAESSAARAPVVQLADRIAGGFVVAVIVLAALTFVLWLGREGSRAVENAVALLIVACPCALGLATPLALSVAIGRAARHGILIKGGEVLERLAGRGRILLDKTGTVTEGRMALVAWHGDEQVKPLVAALESHSSHPVARALAGASDEEYETSDVRLTSRSIEGCVAGERLLVGAPAALREQGVEVPPALAAAERELVANALTPVLVARDGVALALAGLGDPVRRGAGEAIEALGSLGWRASILSGDAPEVVDAVARRVGVGEAVGGATPEDKLERVKASNQEGSVVMVGDGVNDAAALAAAEVGIAVHGGAEASLAAAGVYMNRPGLAPLVELVRGARSAMAAIRRCLLVSLLYNAAASALAMAGLIHPLLAAILMPVSSFTVLVLAFAQGSFRGAGSGPARPQGRFLSP